MPAVSEARFSVGAGETLVLLGENGAGKSTLMKVLAGVYPLGTYAGSFRLDGVEAQFRNVREAEQNGVVLVPQELHVAPNLSIAENILMGMLPTRFGIVDRAKARQKAKQCLDFFELDVDPDVPAKSLSASEQRLIMISAALAKSAAKVLILDEPTASLTDGEAEHLFEKMEQVRATGVATIYITHRLDEIERVCDRAVVMRNGAVVLETPDVQGRRSEFIRAMIGHDPAVDASLNRAAPGAEILEVRDLWVRGSSATSKPHVCGVSLSARAGEILGLFGLVGAGRTELASAVFGAWRGDVTGDVRINGVAGRPTSPGEGIARGVGMLTEDRKRSGLIEGQSVLRNISAASLGRVCKAGVIHSKNERARAESLARDLDLRPPNIDAMVENFSGGNQQKIMLARWMATDPDLLIVDEPTYGVDVGARYAIYERLRALSKDGTAILMISSDIEEIMHEADRILVMYKGQIAGEFEPGVSRRELMAAATGETHVPSFDAVPTTIPFKQEKQKIGVAI